MCNKIPIVLVGNKLDLDEERQVSTEEGRGLAQKFACGFLEASAKTNTNIKEIFFELVRMMIKWRQSHPELCQSEKKAKKGNCTLL